MRFCRDCIGVRFRANHNEHGHYHDDQQRRIERNRGGFHQSIAEYAEWRDRNDSAGYW